MAVRTLRGDVNPSAEQVAFVRAARSLWHLHGKQCSCGHACMPMACKEVTRSEAQEHLSQCGYTLTCIPSAPGGFPHEHRTQVCTLALPVPSSRVSTKGGLAAANLSAQGRVAQTRTFPRGRRGQVRARTPHTFPECATGEAALPRRAGGWRGASTAPAIWRQTPTSYTKAGE